MHALLKGARLPVYAQRHSVTSGFLIRFPAKKSNFVSAESSSICIKSAVAYFWTLCIVGKYADRSTWARIDCCVISSRVMLKSEAVLVGTLPASFLGRLRTSSAGFHHDRYGVSLLCETSTSVYGLYLRLNIIFSEAEGKLILVSSAVF